MARSVYIWDGEKMVEASEYRARAWDSRSKHIIDDSMEATFHPATGRTHESKSAFRRDTRESGCVEIGNDWNGTKAPSKYGIHDKRALADAYRAAKAKHRN